MIGRPVKDGSEFFPHGDIATVILTGVSANIAVNGTAIEAAHLRPLGGPPGITGSVTHRSPTDGLRVRSRGLG